MVVRLVEPFEVIAQDAEVVFFPGPDVPYLMYIDKDWQV